MAKILVVDEDVMVREMLGTMLSEHGYEVCIAENGNSAITAGNGQPVDLVVTDMSMDSLDGLDLITALKRQYRGAKIIALSGGMRHVHGRDSLSLARALGADRSLSKPVPMSDLIGAVADLVGN